MAIWTQSRTGAWLDRIRDQGFWYPQIRCVVLQAISDVAFVPWLIICPVSMQWRHERGVRGLSAERRIRTKQVALKRKAHNCGGACCVAQWDDLESEQLELT